MTDKATPTPSPASADTRDIVLRLRDTPNWLYESYASWKNSVCKYSRAPFEAADEIERLRAEVERLAAQAAPTERDAQDAARYQWLRKAPWNWDADGTPRASPWVVSGESHAEATPISLDELDAAIDAAMAKD